MKQIIAKCIPKSFVELCDNQINTKEEQEFSRDFIHNPMGKENLFKVENIYDSSFIQNSGNYPYNPGFKLYQMVKNSNEEIVPLSAHRINDSKISENSSNWLLTNQSIDDDLIRTNPKMILEELESNDILKKEKLIINAAGLVNGARKANDGFAFFGKSFQNSFGKVVNDYELNIPIQKNESNDHMFVIYFKKSVQHYYLRSFVNSMSMLSFLLLRLGDVSYPYQIKRNEFLMLGEIVFKIRTEPNGDLVIIKLSNLKYPEEIILKYQCDQGKVTIGRNNQCSIPFPNEQNLSKIHCTFEYIDTIQSWAIHDGGNKPSTNGTWIMPKHSVDVTKGCTFKLFGSSKFVLFPLP